MSGLMGWGDEPEPELQGQQGQTIEIIDSRFSNKNST